MVLTTPRVRSRAFSLVELVIVIVIIGIIGAIAIPRMSRGAAGAADSALTANLSILRNAINLYEAEHGGKFPTVADFVGQMTTYTDDAGTVNATKTDPYVYGPYLRAIPALPVGANKGKSAVAAADGTGVGWIYDATTGKVKANCADAEVDARGVKYNAY
jgi:prepilin-type N-terminal cleavage/methylation domain-containing protein